MQNSAVGPVGASSTRASNAGTTIRADSGRPIATVAGDVAIRSHWNASSHELRVPVPAHAVDVSALAAARDAGATTWCDLADDGSCWDVPLDSFYGPDSFSVSRGYGDQRAVPSRLWAYCPAGQDVLPGFAGV